MRWDDSELSNLPPEAFNEFAEPFDPNAHWLETADREEQLTAMREWFYARFCDPALDTPYNGREGGYLFVEGGPYDPADELPTRFSGIVDDVLIQELIEELHAEVGDRWAPVRHRPPDDYDDRYDVLTTSQEEPYLQLKVRLKQIQSVLLLEGDWNARLLAQNLAFSASVTALESFLWETVEYWLENDESVLQNIVKNIPELRDVPLKLGDIFEQHEGLKNRVKGYLQNLVWHRFDKVAPLMRLGLGVQPPSFKPFVSAVEKRHDIVHRSGHDKSGGVVSVSAAEIHELCNAVEVFGNELHSKLVQRAASQQTDPGTGLDSLDF